VLGVLLAALSAACFAFNNASTRRGVLTGTVPQAMAITVPLGVPIFVLVALATGNLPIITTFSPDAVRLLAMVGILHFICGRYCNYRAVKALGTNLSGPVVQLSVLVTIVLAVLLLDEALTPLRLLGIVLVILGPAMMRQTGAAASPEAATEGKLAPDGLPAFRPHYAEGYVFAALAAVAYGVSPVMLRAAVEGDGIGGSLAAGIVSYGAATIVIGLLLLWPGQLRHVLAMDRRSLKWFTWSGVFVCISQMFFYMAVSVAPVSVVMPMLQIQLLLRYFFARIFNPHHEVFGGRIILGTLLSMLGAVALAISTELVLSLRLLPDWLTAVLHWPRP
jgi:drug/metabolite transporter (DMT)-like permease